MIIFALLACTPPDADTTPASGLVPLDAPALLRRMSLDLTGQLPSADDLDAVEADPTRLDDYRDGLLDDPRLEDRLVDLFGQRFLTLLDTFEVHYYDYHLDASQEYEFERSVGEEPLRLMAHVAVTDMPWTEIVTGDWTMANETLAGIWPLDYPADESGWQVSTYTDARPAAGILATNGLWWRYVTNPSNMNRGRVAAIMRLLLCEDILSRPVSFSGNVTLEGGVSDAIHTRPACIACHSAIEPLASSLFGFYWYTQYNMSEMTTYHPERETLGGLDAYLGATPAYFGTPIAGLVELGQYVAVDHRFERCAAQSASEMLWHRKVGIDDFDQMESLRTRFVAGGEKYRSLLADVTDTEQYRAGSVTASASATVQADERTTRLMNAPLLASAVEGHTGFRWTEDGFDQLSNDDVGFRTLAGGVDGDNVTAPQEDPGLTWAYTVKRFAEGAASWSVAQELPLGGDDEGLLHYVDADSRPGDAVFSAEIEELYWRMYAQRPDDDWITSAETLWSAAYDASDAQGAWTTLIASMIRDPAFVGY